MLEETINIAKAKKHILITKRGKPMARLVPADEIATHLSKAKGWLEDVLIAASALTNQCTMVTANPRHFSRIKALKAENWCEQKSN